VDAASPQFNAEKLRRRAETEMRRRKETRVTAEVSGRGLDDEQLRRLGETSGKEIFWTPNILDLFKNPVGSLTSLPKNAYF
jgi:hypothetical protein